MKTVEGVSTLLHAGAAQPALAAHLDSLLSSERIAQMSGLSPGELRDLFVRCAGAAPLALHDLVPLSTTPGSAVAHMGINSLPLFRSFQKRFTRLPSGVVVGYNHQQMSPLTGPGYFTVTPAPDGELLFDYTTVPSEAEVLPASWPAVSGNQRGLWRFVYKGLNDLCRRVSRDVMIGQASRQGQPMDQFFALTRSDLTIS